MATITKRGKRWRAQVRVEGVYRSKTFSTKGAAEIWAQGTEDAARMGTLAVGEMAGMTLADAIGEYEVYRRGHKPLSDTIRGNLRRWSESTGETRLGALTAAHMLAHAQGRDCGPATMLIELSALRGVLTWAKAKGLKIEDPISGALPALRQVRLVAKSAERDRRPTDDELKLMRAAFLGRRLPMADLMDFAIATAMRLGEIVSLQWADLDLEKRLVLIRDRKDPKDKEGNHQWVPLLGNSLAIIDRQPVKGPRIFPFHGDAVSRAWTQTASRLGILDLHFHDLRHHGVSRLFEAGYQIQEVALVSGHKSWASLKRYTNLKPESLHR